MNNVYIKNVNRLHPCFNSFLMSFPCHYTLHLHPSPFNQKIALRSFFLCLLFYFYRKVSRIKYHMRSTKLISVVVVIVPPFLIYSFLEIMRNVYTFDVCVRVFVHVKYDSISSHVILCNKRHHKGCNDINVCFNCKMFFLPFYELCHSV